MDEYQWGIYGYPADEDCEVEQLQEVEAYAWSGDFEQLSVACYHFIVGQPDPRSEGHNILGLRRVQFPAFEDYPPTVEIQILLQGECSPNSWEQFRVLAYDTPEDLTQAFATEMSWAGTPNFK